MLEGEVWLTRLRCRANACSLDRREAAPYIQSNPLRPNCKTREKEVGIQLTLKNCQEDENEVISG